MAIFKATTSNPGADFGSYSKGEPAHGFANFTIPDADGNPVKWGYIAFKTEGNEQLQRIAAWLEADPTRIARLVAKSMVNYVLNKPKARAAIDLDAL